MGWDDQNRGLRSIDKATYSLEMDEDNGMGRLEQRSVLDQQGHVLAGDGQRQWDGMIRTEVCAQSTRPHTGWRWTKTMGWDDQNRGLHSIDKATYHLEMDEDKEMG